MKRTLALLLLIFIAPVVRAEGPLDETRIVLRQEMLRQINRDRRQFGLNSVQLDPFASTLGDQYCREQIRHGTTGHFTVDGQAPYMRYSFAGGNDGISENAAAWSAAYRFSDRELYQLIRGSQDAMMSEVPPDDGHRRTILDPHATHVGIGLAWERGELRLVQEFIRRYVDWQRPLPRRAHSGETVSVGGRPINGYRVEAISVHHEAAPQPLAASVVNRIKTYRLPETRRDYLPMLKTFYQRRSDGTVDVIREEYTNGRRGDFRVAKDGAFDFAVPFTEGPGVYTVVVWVRREAGGTPIAASNVSVFVEPAPSAPAYRASIAR